MHPQKQDTIFLNDSTLQSISNYLYDYGHSVCLHFVSDQQAPASHAYLRLTLKEIPTNVVPTTATKPTCLCFSQLVMSPLSPSAPLRTVLNVMRKGEWGLGEIVLILKGQRFGASFWI